MPFDTIKGGLKLCAAGALDVSDGPPEWVNIVPLPAGATRNIRVEARDGRVFIIEDAATLVAESNAELARQRGPHPVDKDHQMTSWWKPGGPALGWTDRYELRSDGIYAHMERWLPEGTRLIGSFEYRYSSCNVWCDITNEVEDRWGWVESYDLLMKRLAGFTITNIPALEVYAMAARENASMSMLQVLAELGLPESGKPDDILAAVKKLKLSAAPSLDQFVPRAEFDRVQAELTQAKTTAAKAAEEAAAAEREQLLADALKAGKVTPATADYFRESMKQPAGVEHFKKFCAAAPEIGGRVEETRKPPLGGGTTGLTPNELHACRIAGMDPAAFAQAKAELATKKSAA